jgi:hypothetical protein
LSRRGVKRRRGFQPARTRPAVFVTAPGARGEARLRTWAVAAAGKIAAT